MSAVKDLPANVGDTVLGLILGGKIPGGEMATTPEFLPGGTVDRGVSELQFCAGLKVRHDRAHTVDLLFVL